MNESGVLQEQDLPQLQVSLLPLLSPYSYFLCIGFSQKQTSHRSSSELSPHPSTPLHRMAVERQRLLAHWNVPFGQT